MVKSITILITGGSGFLGKNLLEKLPSAYKILAPSHKDLELLDEQAVENFLKKHVIDIVIHCSNIGGTRNTSSIQNVAVTNLRIFFNILRCKNRYSKLIFLGSGAEYDKKRPLKKVQEADFDKFIPSDEYGFYKYICSKIIEKSDNIINLRLFGVFGKYEDYNLRFISQAICKNILGLPITINQNVIFDYLYVNDLVKIIDFFIQKSSKEKFINIGCGKEMDLVSIAKNINNLAERKSKIVVINKELQNEYTCNNSLLLKTIPNITFTDFNVALGELFDYYKNIKSTIHLVT